MNKARRKELYALIRNLNKVRFNDNIDNHINTLDSIKYDEEYTYNRIPENLQYSFRAEQSEVAIEHMEDALNLLSEAQDSDGEEEFKHCIQDAISEIQKAIV